MANDTPTGGWDFAKFNFPKSAIGEALVRELATGAFLDAGCNAIFIGDTGTGKTQLSITVASAVASAVIPAKAGGLFYNLIDLVNQLE